MYCNSNSNINSDSKSEAEYIASVSKGWWSQWYSRIEKRESCLACTTDGIMAIFYSQETHKTRSNQYSSNHEKYKNMTLTSKFRQLRACVICKCGSTSSKYFRPFKCTLTACCFIIQFLLDLIKFVLKYAGILNEKPLFYHCFRYNVLMFFQTYTNKTPCVWFIECTLWQKVFDILYLSDNILKVTRQEFGGLW